MGECAFDGGTAAPGYGRSMAVAALVLSILSLLVTGLALLYFKRQAQAAGTVAAIERARRHDEQVPKLQAEIEAVGEGGWHRLWLHLMSTEARVTVTLEILDDCGIVFGRDQQGVDHGPLNTKRTTATGVLTHEHPEAWRVELGAVRPSVMRLVVAANGAGGWRIPLKVTVPTDMARSIW